MRAFLGDYVKVKGHRDICRVHSVNLNNTYDVLVDGGGALKVTENDIETFNMPKPEKFTNLFHSLYFREL